MPVLSLGAGGEKIANLITQSALLKMLERHLHFFDELTKRSLLDLGLGTPVPVVAIEEHQTVLDAFHLIREQARVAPC